MTDLMNPAFLEPALFLLLILLAAPIAVLPARMERTKRSLALLVVLVASFGALREVLPLALSPWPGLLVFLGVYGVFHLLGRFDAPE